MSSIGLAPTFYGTHTMRRTKATLNVTVDENPRAVQLLLGSTKLDNTVRHLGIGVDDALEISEQTELRRSRHRKRPSAERALPVSGSAMAT